MNKICYDKGRLQKKTAKKMTLCKKGGGWYQEKIKFVNVLLKVTFHSGRGVDQNQCHFFKMFINSSFSIFSAHPVTSTVKFLI